MNILKYIKTNSLIPTRNLDYLSLDSEDENSRKHSSHLDYVKRFVPQNGSFTRLYSTKKDVFKIVKYVLKLINKYKIFSGRATGRELLLGKKLLLMTIRYISLNNSAPILKDEIAVSQLIKSRL